MILDMIKNNEFKDNKLPPEGKLAKKLRVSLSTLREALVILNNDGIIDKKHGSGSYVHKSALNAKMRIDIITNFQVLLEEAGYEPFLEHISKEKVKFREIASDNLEAPFEMEEEILSFERLFYGDDIPAIRVQVNMPVNILEEEPSQKDFEKPLTQFIWEFCYKELAQSIIEYIPISAGEKEKKLFNIESGTPLISWKEVFYDYKDYPISCNKIVFNPKIINLRMLRQY